MNIANLKKYSIITLNQMFNLLFSVYLAYILSIISIMITHTFIEDINFNTIFYSSFLILSCVIFYYLLTKKFSAFQQISNGVFCFYTGYFISFFSMTIIYLVFSKIRSSFDHSFSYHNITELPRILILIATIFFGFLLFTLIHYLEQKEYIKIKIPNYAYKIIFILILHSCMFFILMSLIASIVTFRKNFVWWSFFAFLPSATYASLYVNKYLAYILTAGSLFPVTFLTYQFFIL